MLFMNELESFKQIVIIFFCELWLDFFLFMLTLTSPLGQDAEILINLQALLAVIVPSKPICAWELNQQNKNKKQKRRNSSQLRH